MSELKLVEKKFLPVTVRQIFAPSKLIVKAQAELTFYAQNDPDECWGYFPTDPRANNNGLDDCRRFQEAFPTITIDGHTFGFSFLRLSLKKQKPLRGKHVDGNAGTGIKIPGQDLRSVACRAFFSLSDQEEREMSISHQAPASLPLVDAGGLMTIKDSELDPSYIESIVIPRRSGPMVSGIVFYPGEVPHGGDDTESGHYVASYGREEYI